VERHVHFGWGHGPGVLDFLWDVDLLGKRVAYYLSSENEEGWTALHDLMYERASAGLALEQVAADSDDKWLM
jgi:hypothetical protein